MHILVRTDLGILRILNTEDITVVDGSGVYSTVTLKSHPDFPFKVALGIKDFYEVLLGKADFFDLYIDDKLVEDSSEKTQLDEVLEAQIKEETPESLDKLEEFKKGLKPLKELKPATFSKKKVAIKKEVDTQSDTW